MKKRDWLNSGLLLLAFLIIAALFAQSRRNCEIPGSSWVPCICQPLKKYQTDMSDRRFPAPWKVEKIAGGFKVIDANGQSLAYVYSRETKDAANIAGVLTEDEARRIAAHIAKLPVLLGQARPEDVLRPRAISRMSVIRPKTPRPRTSHRAREGGA